MKAMVLGLALVGGGAAAQTPAVDCSRVRVAVPAEFAGWSDANPVTAGPAARIVVGKAAQVALSSRAAGFVVPAKKPGGQGGVVRFAVAQAGVYRVGLGSGAWVDVVRGREAVASLAHGHGPACSGIRKTVDFRLSPGDHVLQLSDSAAAVVPVMIARLP